MAAPPRQLRGVRSKESKERRREKWEARRAARLAAADFKLPLQSNNDDDTAGSSAAGPSSLDTALMSPDDVAALRLEEITRGIRDLRIDTRAQIDTLVSRVGALEGLASPANGPIGAAAAGSSTAPSTSTAGSDAAMAALSARIRDLEAGLASARTDLASVRTELSGTQLSLGVAEERLERIVFRARLLAGQATDNEEGIRAVAELMGQWANRQLTREEVAEAVEEMLAEDDDSVQ